jgi:hypothetical protein
MNSRRRISASQRFVGKAYSDLGGIETALMAACGFSRDFAPFPLQCPVVGVKLLRGRRARMAAFDLVQGG